MADASTSRRPAIPAGNSQALRRPQDEVFHALRRDILLGRLHPRERLIEEELTMRFGVGRYVVRSALDELSRIGLVSRRPNRGVVVSDYNPAEVAKLYEMREILQRAAVTRITLPAAPDLVKELRRINQHYAESYARGELEEVAEANAAFHRALFGACENQYLAETIEQFRQKTAAVHGYAIGVPQLATQSYQDHEQMIDALERGERERLADLCIQHMVPALEAVLLRGPDR